MSMTGPRTSKFERGWALPLWSWGKAHFFERVEAGLARSICGRKQAMAGKLFEEGNWRRCALCERKLSTKGTP